MCDLCVNFPVFPQVVWGKLVGSVFDREKTNDTVLIRKKYEVCVCLCDGGRLRELILFFQSCES